MESLQNAIEAPPLTHLENQEFLRMIRDARQRLGCDPPEKVEILFNRVSVEAVVPLGRRTVPTLPNAIINGVKSNMEALRVEPVAEGETRVSSVQVVSQVLTKNSSKVFLKSIGIEPVGSSKLAESNESELREQVAAEARAAVQDELDALKKSSEEANEKLERQQRDMEEMRKQTEINNKEIQENNALLRRLLSLNNPSST